jgi:hypothetical protein
MNATLKVGRLIGLATAVLLATLAGTARGEVIGRATSPVKFTLENPRNGDNVTFTGVERIFFMQGNPDFGFHLSLHLTGLATNGARYVVNAHNTTVTVYNALPQQIGTMVSGNSYITPGPRNNLVFKAWFHITITPSGDVVTQVVNATTECR